MENSVMIHNLTADEFFERIRSAVREEIKTNYPEIKEEPRYLTRREAAAFLKISLQTLHQYTRSGRINAYRMGYRVLYRMDDLELNMSSIPVSKYVKGTLKRS